MDSAKLNFDVSLFFDLSPDLFCISDFDGKFKKVNPAVCQLLGYSETELLAQPVDHFIHPDDRPATQLQRQRLSQAHPLLHFDNRYITKAGEIVWLTWTSMPLKSERLIYAIAKDITHKKNMEAERNLILADLSAVNIELQQFGLTSAHDLRAPVNNLLSIFSLLEASGMENQEVQKVLDLFKLATHSLKKTIDKHLETISPKSKKHLPLEEIDIKASLTKVLQSIQALVLQSEAQINIDFSAFSQITFKRANLESILLNLITNAIKYAQPGQAPSITISTQYDEWEQKQLVIADKGLGFDLPAVKDKIFGLHETFHRQIKPSQESKGIGLYLVYNHVTNLGGSIQIESKPNQGSQFTITFKGTPQNSDHEAAPAAEALAHDPLIHESQIVKH